VFVLPVGRATLIPMDSNRFRGLLETPGPFASVYFEDSHDTHDAETQLDLKWRALREELERQGVAEPVTAEIEHAVKDLRPPIGRSGRGVIAGATGVVLNEHLLQPTAETMVRVSELPYIVPILEHGFEQPDYLLAVVDHAGADITTHVNGTLRSETVDGGGYPVHKAAGAETAGYGDPQLRTDEAARKNIRAVADRVSELVDKYAFDAVFVVGEVRSRSDLLSAFPERVAERAVPLQVGARHSGHDFGEIQQAIEDWFLGQRQSAIEAAEERFTAEVGRGSGLAAEGLDAVCSALRQGAVDTLIIGDVEDATVVADEGVTTVAPNANVLSEQGAAPAKTLRADEALPLFAISVGASLVRADERIAPADGVAAVLRYAPTLH
jgi:peptide chain release factor subunit 1